MTDINSVIVPHMYSDEGEPLSDPKTIKILKLEICICQEQITVYGTAIL